MKNVMMMGLCAVLIGCVAPSAKKMAEGDHGPFPEDYEQLVQKWMSDTFFDPYSVRDLEVTKPVQGAVGQPLIRGGGYIYGWRSFVTANAKNRMGAYIGKHTHVVYFRNGSVIASGDVFRGGSLPDMMF